MSTGTSGGRVRLATVIGVAVAAIAAFGVMGGAGLAGSLAKPAKAQYGQYHGGNKITICHKGKVTIRVSISAWPAHARHGDQAGACASSAKQPNAKAEQHGAAKHESSGQGASSHAGGNGKSEGKGKK